MSKLAIKRCKKSKQHCNLTLNGSEVGVRGNWFHVEVLQRFDDVCASHWEATKGPLVENFDVQRWGIQVLFGKVLEGEEEEGERL